jgi:hypothetical protein
MVAVENHGIMVLKLKEQLLALLKVPRSSKLLWGTSRTLFFLYFPLVRGVVITRMNSSSHVYKEFDESSPLSFGDLY